MTGRVFLDSNVLIYAHDVDAGAKHRLAAARLEELWEHRTGCLSTQVLQEFYVSVTQKIPAPLSRGAAREVVRNYAGWVHAPLTPATALRASEISEVWQLSFWDGMILAAAEQEGAETLRSEDLRAGQRIAGVQVIDPFLS